MAAFIQSEIESTLEGVTVEMQSVPKKVRIENMQAGDFDIALHRWGADYDDPNAFLSLYASDRTASSNFGKWTSGEYDALLKEINTGDLATKPEERWEACKELERILIEDVGFMPLYQNGEATLTRPGVTGMDYHFIGIEWIYRDLVKAAS